MAEQHVKFLQGAGIPQDVIDQLEGMEPEAAKSWDPGTVLPTVRTALKESFKTDFLNDAEFLGSIPEDRVPESVKKKIEAGQYTRFQNELLEAAKKQLGLEDTDLADLTEEERKSIKKTVVKIAEKHLGKKGSVEGAKQLQAEVTRLTGELEAKDSAWQAKLDTTLSETNGKANTKVIKALTRAELKELDGVEIAVNPAYVIDPVLSKVAAKYNATIILTDSDELVLKQKADNNLDVMENGKPVRFKDALKAVVLEEKLGKVKEGKEDEGEDPKRKKIVIGAEGEKGSFELPGAIANKIKANQELEK